MTQAANDTGIVKFSYEKPDVLDAPKKHFRLARSGILGFNIQVLRDGGETNLHAHAAEDAAWFVLGGRVRFYETEDKVTCEAGRHEGIAIPHGSPYWFESASEEPLEIIRMSARNPMAKNQRLNFNALRERQASNHEADLVSADAAADALPMEPIKYDGTTDANGTNRLWDTDLLNVTVHKIDQDLEVQPQKGKDETWFVLNGKARFLSGGDTHEVAVNEGVFVPEGNAYKIQAVDGPLEIMHVTARGPQAA